jgi:ATP-binding cassette subfamily B protein
VGLRRVLALAKPEWKRLTLATVFLVFGSGAGLLYPQAVRVIIDRALNDGNAAMIDWAALAMLAIFLLQAVAIAARYALFTIAGERIVARLRQDLYSRILQQEVAFFDQRRTGELLNRLSSDTAVLQNAVSSNISMALRNVAQTVGGVAFLFYTSPTLAAMMLVVIPPIAIGARWYGRELRKLSREVQDALAVASEVAEESIAGIRTVRSFTAEPLERARYHARIEESFALARRRSVLGGLFMGVASFFGLAAAVFVLWYGGHLVVAGGMSLGELTAFLVYTVIVAVSLGSLSGLWTDFMKASGASERVFALMDRAPLMKLTGGDTIAVPRGAVELCRVDFSYPARPDVQVLRGIELTLTPGQVLAVVGPSGAGKSTIAGLVARLYDPSAGVITFDGRDVRALDPSWLRTQVATVAQEPILFSTSVRENIRYGRPDATDDEIVAAARAANADDFISGFPDGYDTPVGERGIQLSGGQKQRVAIARAILKDPRVLILDEATSALDAESEHLVKDALDRLMRGRATLVIAHRLSTVVDADRVAVIGDGRVVQWGDHGSLMREEGLYRQLIERQFVAA